MKTFQKAAPLFLFAVLAAARITSADAPKQSSDLAAKKVGDGIQFQCSAPGASEVYLAGDFNSWAEATAGVITDAKFKMDGPDSDGVWKKTVTLAAGEHKFKFSIGGKPEGWFAPDWAKKDSDGNAIITITADGEVAGHASASTTSSAEKKSSDSNGSATTFQFTAPEASAVYLAGDFNSWAENKDGAVSDSKYAMTKGDDGVWKTEVTLTPGKHSYKFVVDGSKWEADPKVSEKDASGNSVVDAK